MANTSEEFEDDDLDDDTDPCGDETSMVERKWWVCYSDHSNGGPDLDGLTNHDIMKLVDEGRDGFVMYEYVAPGKYYKDVGRGILFDSSWCNDSCEVIFFYAGEV